MAILFLNASLFLPFLCLYTEVDESPPIPTPAILPLFILLSAARLSVIHNKDLLATIHLLVAMVKRFQPELELPPDVKVEVVVVEVSFFHLYLPPWTRLWCRSRFPTVCRSAGEGSNPARRWKFSQKIGEQNVACLVGRCVETHGGFWLFEQDRLLQLSRQHSEWVKKVPSFDMLTLSNTTAQPEVTFPGSSVSPEEDPIDQLLKLEAHKVNTVKQV